MEESDKSKFRDILQSNWFGHFKIMKALKGKKRPNNCLSWNKLRRNDDETEHNSGLDSQPVKNIIVKTGEIVMGSQNYILA